MASSLRDELAEALPDGIQFTFHHITSPPTRCSALYSAPPGCTPEQTSRQSHFITVSIEPGHVNGTDTGHSSSTTRAGGSEKGAVFVFGLELLVYTTAHLTTIFVSKADSTGYLSLLPPSQASTRPTSSPAKIIARAFVAYLVRRQRRKRPGVRLNVSLFARAQDQYLFPESIENGRKHVLDDRGLIRWWCGVLDPLLDDTEGTDVQDGMKKPDGRNGSERRPQSRAPPRAYLLVPGLDKHDTLRSTPRRQHPNVSDASTSTTPPWSHGHPLLELASNPGAPPRCLVPHFPDDPKARFLDELDEELPDAAASSSQGADANPSPSKRAGSGLWRSVRSLDQFWEMMAFRQECSSGRLVGFIWLVFPPAEEGQRHDGSSQSSVAALSSAPTTHARSPSVGTHDHPATPSPKPTRPRKPLRGLIRVRVGRHRPRPTNGVADSSSPSPSHAAPSSSCSTYLPLSDRDYHRATEELLTHSFANQASSTTATARWVREVGTLGGLGRDTDWGWTVVGQQQPQVEKNGPAQQPPAGSGTSHEKVDRASASAGAVNVLNGSMVRKRKKGADDLTPQADVGSVSTADRAAAVDGAVNVLGAGLVRKKAKT